MLKAIAADLRLVCGSEVSKLHHPDAHRCSAESHSLFTTPIDTLALALQSPAIVVYAINIL